MQDMLPIIAAVRSNPRLINQHLGYMSTSECLILCLGVGTKASIAKLADTNFPTIADAWHRIGPTGQRIVTAAWEQVEAF